MIKPKRLEKGNTIGIISPSSACPKDKLYEGIKYLESKGYKIKLSKHVFDNYNGYGGNDDARAQDLNNFFEDDEVDAIICSRGGYGAVRILDKLNYDIIKNNNKIFAGYSDITSFHLALYEKAELITFHAPMVSIDMLKEKSFDENSLNNMFDILSSNEKIVYKNPDGSDFESISFGDDGKAQGILIGGNFIVMMSSFGNEYFPKLNKDYILYIEEVDEKPYKIDRIISTLFNSKEIRKSIKGIVVGDFINCDLLEGEKETGFRTARETIIERLSNLNIPVLTNVKCGHGKTKLTIAHGAMVQIDAYNKSFETLENVLI
ncbi:LD-carboxypeptidase [Brachyspira sp.]|uniref:S66 peptidase family protein n=1 Tax=Brachyspira sp. TaxID=1977261 RepID=UPI00262FDAEC|nr:LD-carboxypeptidase [Brachyspira sp.]